MPRLHTLAGAAAPDAAPSAKPSGPQPAERVALRVGPSAIDGQGVFADEAIAVRQKIGEMRGQTISVSEARRRVRQLARIHIVEISARTAIDASDSDSLLRFVNHSCAPNAVLHIRQGRAEFFALRDIASGEEITCNYGQSHHAGRLRCSCGAAQCVGRL
ncbi:SET domain-containing protein [Roseateles sp. BYS180W]|uniref:SET domain-containing protein n=1 Tax=Roseateles rivi TaxID=3299028 RepID=A0ABW7FVL0_9BURK